MYIPYIIKRRMENIQNNIGIKRNKKLKNNKYIYLKLSRRTASLVINSLALAKRYIYYNKTEEIPVEIFFNKNDINEDIFDLTFFIQKITEDCKNNFYNWKEYKIYKS